MKKPTEFEPLLDETMAAKALGRSVSYLQKDRCRKDRPPTVPFVKVGGFVRYHPAVIRRLRGES